LFHVQRRTFLVVVRFSWKSSVFREPLSHIPMVLL